MRRERRKRQAHGSHERWLVSYADFITLLFAFFVVLYASSKADQKKQQQVSQAIDSAFHSLGLFPDLSAKLSPAATASSASQPASPAAVAMAETLLSPAQVRDDLQRMQKSLEKALASQIAQHAVSIHMGPDGLVVSLREAGFFTSGSATPQPATLPVLRQVARYLGQTAYDVRIEGHTDNVPIHNQEFDSNWELSAARATRIARIFLATRAIAPGRLSASGYAEFHPVATNDTAAGRSENRRVDLVIRPRSQIDFAQSPAPAPQPAANPAWRKVTEP